MKFFEIKFKVNRQAKARCWKVKAKSAERAEQTVLRVLAPFGPTAKVLSVTEIAGAKV
jgi:hypothetical protein